MQGLNTTSYLTKSLLNKIYKKELSNDELDDKVLSGELIKHFSYYKASELLLRKLKVIPDTVDIEQFSLLAKKASFVLREIQEIFGDCHKDTVKIIARKYFKKKHNLVYNTIK